MSIATDDEIETIRKRAYNQTARDMQHDGVKLTWEQADDLGDQAIDWMRSRLGLKSSTSDRGITFRPNRKVSSHAHATRKAASEEARVEDLDREIAPTLGRTRSEIVRQINAIVRAADGRNVYVTRQRLGEAQVQRVTRARTKGRGMEVRSLASGQWLPVSPELGDRIDVR